MTLTENAVFTTPLDVPTGRGARRLPITDVGAYLNGLPEDACAGLRALGELIVCRAVLAADDTGLLTTTALLAEGGSDCYRPSPAEGLYL